MSIFRHVFASLIVAGACVTACGSDDGSSTSGTSGTTGQTACAQDARKDIYTAGLSKQGGSISVKLVDSTPSPPAKLMNQLDVIVTDGGKPIDNATITVTPWMPDHAHGSAVVPIVTAKGGGQYHIEKIYYPMPGLWQLTLTITAPGAAPQDVVFKFCLEG